MAMTLHDCLVQLLGAEPGNIDIRQMDGFYVTANIAPLLRWAGGPWGKLVAEVEAREAERKNYRIISRDEIKTKWAAIASPAAPSPAS